MEHTRKLVVIDPARTSLYRPTATDRKLSALDQDVANTLNSDEPDDVKAKRYLEVLKQFYDTPAAPPKPDPDAQIIKSVAQPLRIKAKRLLDHIKPHARLAETGELVHDNQLIEDSSISELLSDALTENSGEKPVGWVEFADTLKRSKTSG